MRKLILSVNLGVLVVSLFGVFTSEAQAQIFRRRARSQPVYQNEMPPGTVISTTQTATPSATTSTADAGKPAATTATTPGATAMPTPGVVTEPAPTSMVRSRTRAILPRRRTVEYYPSAQPAPTVSTTTSTSSSSFYTGPTEAGKPAAATATTPAQGATVTTAQPVFTEPVPTRTGRTRRAIFARRRAGNGY
jgi:hypothetical protein